jgi:tRNA pseudouridine38-40 synthase
MADNNDSRDRKRARGGNSFQHGSRPNKKRNMGRKEHL